jgi:hypothetical protein
VEDVRLRAVYNIDAGETTGILLFVFTAVSQDRHVIANSEGTLYWIPRREVLNLDSVEDIPYILPRIFEMHPGDAPLFVHVTYDEQDRIQMRFADHSSNE